MREGRPSCYAVTGEIERLARHGVDRRRPSVDRDVGDLRRWVAHLEVLGHSGAAARAVARLGKSDRVRPRVRAFQRNEPGRALHVGELLQLDGAVAIEVPGPGPGRRLTGRAVREGDVLSRVDVAARQVEVRDGRHVLRDTVHVEDRGGGAHEVAVRDHAVDGRHVTEAGRVRFGSTSPSSRPDGPESALAQCRRR